VQPTRIMDPTAYQGWDNKTGDRVLQQRRRCGAGVGAMMAVANIDNRLPGELGC